MQVTNYQLFGILGICVSKPLASEACVCVFMVVFVVVVVMVVVMVVVVVVVVVMVVVMVVVVTCGGCGGRGVVGGFDASRLVCVRYFLLVDHDDRDRDVRRATGNARKQAQARRCKTKLGLVCTTTKITYPVGGLQRHAVCLAFCFSCFFSFFLACASLLLLLTHLY